jgi:hypothetical protein
VVPSNGEQKEAYATGEFSSPVPTETEELGRGTGEFKRGTEEFGRADGGTAVPPNRHRTVIEPSVITPPKQANNKTKDGTGGNGATQRVTAEDVFKQVRALATTKSLPE